MTLNPSTEKSVAVLPFVNMSSDDENEFFCDGITEEIIDALAKINGLRVISRTSSFYFKRHQLTLSEIAEKLNVAILLEGSVKIANDQIRVKAQLINVAEDQIFWSNSWDRPRIKLFDVQDEISLLIADQLRENLGHLTISDHLVESNTDNLSAYEHHLKGQYHFKQWNPESVHTAIQCFEEAVSMDPNYINGHLGLADSYSFMAVAGFAPREESWMKAVEAMETAKKLNPENAGLNFMLGNQAFFTEADFSSALGYGQKCIATSPTYAEAHRFLSFLHALQGDLKKSREHILFAKSIDPLNPETRFFEANYLYRSSKFAEAETILNDLLESNSKNLPAIIVSIYIRIMDQRLEEAGSFIDNTPDELITPDERLGLKCLIEVSKGQSDSPLLADLEKNATSPMAHHAHAYLFIAYTMLGDNNKAFQILENLFEAKSSILLLAFSDPLAGKLKTDPKYPISHKKVYPRRQKTITTKRKTTQPLEDGEAKVQIERLSEFLSDNRPFLNPTLTLRSLAEQVDIHPNVLSWLINEHTGKNFNEFINQYRIAHFKGLIVDPDNARISIIGLAYESGFNSKTVFNTTFKKEVGMTPKEFQKSNTQ